MAERMGTITLPLCFNISTSCKCISNKGVLNPLKSDQHTSICHFSQPRTPSGRAGGEPMRCDRPGAQPGEAAVPARPRELHPSAHDGDRDEGDRQRGGEAG